MANHSQQQNTTLSLALFTPSECIAWLTVFGIEAVAMVTLNAIVIITYLRERSLRKRSMYLVINQAVADMFLCGFVIIFCWVLGRRCDFWAINSMSSSIAFSALTIAFDFSSLASLLNLSAISLDRTHATFRPFKHRLVKKKIFGVVIVAVWFTAGLFTISIFLVSQVLTFKEYYNIWLPYFSSFLFYLLIIFVSYSSIAIKIVCGNHPHHHGATNRERKLTKRLFIVTVASLLLTTLPYVISFILNIVAFHTVVNLSKQAVFRLRLSVLFLFFANSFVNPVLYTFRMPEFKRVLFAFLSCRSQPQRAQVFPLNQMQDLVCRTSSVYTSGI